MLDQARKFKPLVVLVDREQYTALSIHFDALSAHMHHVYDWLTLLHQIAGLTLDEKVSITTGVGWMNGRCVVRNTSSSRNIICSFMQLKCILYYFYNRVTYRRYCPLKVVVGLDYVSKCIFLNFLVLSSYLR